MQSFEIKRLLPRLYRFDHEPLLVLIPTLCVLYTGFYLANPALPGNNLKYPLGWWGWLDQGHYFQSAKALAAGNLAPSQHWFPLGYSLLAAPFVRLMPNHPFFFPDLLCLVASAFFFLRMSRAFGFSGTVGSLLFLVSLLFDPRVFGTFVVPWNTTLVVALTYFSLFLVIVPQAISIRSAICIGACGALVLATRPSDAMLFAVIGGAMLYRALTEQGAMRALHVTMATGASAVIVVATFASLHFAIYGAHLSTYEIISDQIGFDLRPLPQKLYSFFIDPLPLYGEGEPILHHSIWLLLLPFGLVFSWRDFGVRGAVIAGVIMVNILTYVAYVDLDPVKIFKYLNIHYFKLMYPLAALTAAHGVRCTYKNWRMAASLAASCILILMLRYRLSEQNANVVASGKDGLTVACTGCGSFNKLVLAPALKHVDQAPYSIYVDIGGRELRGLFQVRVNEVDNRSQLIFPYSMSASEFSLRFKKPIRSDVSKATLMQGHFALSFPRLP